MTKINCLLFLLILSSSLRAQDTNKYAKYTEYINKKVQVFIDNPQHTDFNGYTFLSDPITIFRGVRLKYDSVHVNLYISDPQHVEYVSETLKWDFEKVKKEKISRITIIGGQGLIYDSANSKK